MRRLVDEIDVRHEATKAPPSASGARSEPEPSRAPDEHAPSERAEAPEERPLRETDSAVAARVASGSDLMVITGPDDLGNEGEKDTAS